MADRTTSELLARIERLEAQVANQQAQLNAKAHRVVPSLDELKRMAEDWEQSVSAIFGPWPIPGSDPGDETPDRDAVGEAQARQEAEAAYQGEKDQLMDLAKRCADDDAMRPKATDALEGIIKEHTPDRSWVKNLMVGA